MSKIEEIKDIDGEGLKHMSKFNREFFILIKKINEIINYLNEKYEQGKEDEKHRNS